MVARQFLAQEETVTAEQHALDNPGHWLTVKFTPIGSSLIMQCQTCDWWDEQLFPTKEEA